MSPIKALLLVSICLLPVYGMGEERICKPVDSDTRNYEIRWTKGISLEVRGRKYTGGSIHWLDTGGWRTGSNYSWTAGFDEQNVHRFYVNETRYEYDPDHGEGGRLFHHTFQRRASPEATARLRQQKYDFPFPDATPAKEPIHTQGPGEGATHATYAADCLAVDDGSLKLSSDYSMWDIFMLYMRDALEAEADEEEAETPETKK